MNTLKEKLILNAQIELSTGMHIGASSEFAPIGAVDSIVIRDPKTNLPLIPGTTLKGKMRTLMAKALSQSDFLSEPNADEQEIKRLFGATKSNEPGNEGIEASRLQFFDLVMTNASEFKGKTDLYCSEIKFENVIDRKNSQAVPRQLERVPAGAKFNLQIVYDYYNKVQELELKEDFKNIALGFKLLQLDYIGGSGTRGYGKIKISDISIISAKIKPEEVIELGSINTILKNSENVLEKLVGNLIK